MKLEIKSFNFATSSFNFNHFLRKFEKDDITLLTIKKNILYFDNDSDRKKINLGS